MALHRVDKPHGRKEAKWRGIYKCDILKMIFRHLAALPLLEDKSCWKFNWSFFFFSSLLSDRSPAMVVCLFVFHCYLSPPVQLFLSLRTKTQIRSYPWIFLALLLFYHHLSSSSFNASSSDLYNRLIVARLSGLDFSSSTRPFEVAGVPS